MLQYRPGMRSHICLKLCAAAIIASLFLAAPVLHGIGRQEEVFVRADELVREKEYDKALSLLTEYARENPKKFDQVQPRIRKILAVREQYNSTAQALLNEMEKDFPNDGRILTLTNRLNDLDPNRKTETQELLDQIREIALFKSYQKRLEEILVQGQRQITRREYADALKTYIGGLDIYQKDFFSAGYGQAMESRARQGINSLTGSMNNFEPTMNSLLAALRELEGMANQGTEPQNLTAYRTAYNRFGAEVDRFINLRNIYAGADAVFRDDLAQLRRTDPRIADRNFLAFASRLAGGRSDGTRDGMLGVFDALWNQAVPRARELLEAKALAVYAALTNEVTAGNYGRVENRAEVLAGYASFAEDIELRWNRYDQDSSKVTIINQNVPIHQAENYLKYRSLKDTAPYWLILGQVGARLNAVAQRDTLRLWKNGENIAELVRTERISTGTLRQIRQDSQTLANNIQQGTAVYRNLENRYLSSDGLKYINQITAAVSALAKKASDRESASAIVQYTISNELIKTRIKEREAELAQGSALLEGVNKNGYTAKYPTRAAEILTRMETSIEADRQAIQTLINQYNDEPQEIKESNQFNDALQELLAIQTSLEGIRTRSRNVTATARSQSAQAAALRRDGDRLLTEAQTAMTRSDFETASERLSRAGSIYDQSLALEDDEPTLKKRDTTLLNMQTEIAARLNDDVIKRVSALEDQIREAFLVNDFDRAERLLTQAQNIWKLTQTIDNPNLAYWQGMIRAGMRSGRTIPVTAPLYAEMSQLLNEARKNYEEAQKILTSSKSEGQKKLAAARVNIEKIKLVYPMNEEASLLDLRIQQLMDPQAFTKTFAEKVRIAVEGTKRGNNRLQAYNDLIVLRTINPQYTNWQPIIDQAAVDSGQRQAPPDPAAVAEAQNIVERNRATVTSRNQDRMEEARTELARAVRLDPGNAEARNLFNDASRFLAASSTVMDSEAERLYQQVSQALVQNNGIRALALINQIYARNANYRYNSRMVTIERRARDIL
jgi:hypothetical protein